jgi:hypothetical protein
MPFPHGVYQNIDWNDTTFLELAKRAGKCNVLEVCKILQEKGYEFKNVRGFEEKKEPIIKQETLEEVAKKKYPMFKGETYIGNNKKMLKRAAFIAGAKWQQEQNKNLYSEEEVIAILENFSSTFNLITTTPKKWFEQFKNK